MADEKKGITVKIDADLHAEIREYLERHEGMTMAEFITLAVDDELHPKIQQKEGNSMGNMRTMAFQVPEELFQRIKDYLHRNNMSQKEFVLGLMPNKQILFPSWQAALRRIRQMSSSSPLSIPPSVLHSMPRILQRS